MKNVLLMFLLLIMGGIVYLSQVPVANVPKTHTEFTPVVVDKNTKPIALKISSFGYYLKNPIIEPIKASLFDMVIMNYETRLNNVNTKFTKEQIASVKTNKKIFAYVSVGEAESYRDYWAAFGGRKPSWIGQENLYWKGNYAVKDLKNPDWQKIVLAQIDTVIDQGFDGVVLGGLTYDKDNQDDLINLVTVVSRYVKHRNHKLAVLVQDAEELVSNRSYMEAIDGIVRQNLIYSWQANGYTGPKNTDDYIAKASEYLTAVKNEKKAVLVVEYVQGPQWVEAKVYFERRGYVGYSAPKQLNALRLAQ